MAPDRVALLGGDLKMSGIAAETSIGRGKRLSGLGY
jgi:hypothetical protein